MITKEERSERLFRALGGVGGDLIDLAEKQVFRPGIGRRLLPVAVCLALLLGLTALIQPMFRVETKDQAQMAAPALPEAAPAEQEKPSVLQWTNREAAAKERLTVNGTIYYIEAVYEAQNAKLGQLVGTVDGAAVYAGGETWKPDRWGRDMPLEIFVEQAEGGYLYCLTYYAWDGAAYTMEDARELEDLTVFALGSAFADPAELTEEQLVTFFLQTLELEQQAGRRTENLNRYLWYDAAEDRYIIPMEDIAVQLDRYLDGYTWPRMAEHRALVLQTLEMEWDPEGFAAAVFEEEYLILTTDRYVYTIRFAEDRCVYESIQERE